MNTHPSIEVNSSKEIADSVSINTLSPNGGTLEARVDEAYYKYNRNVIKSLKSDFTSEVSEVESTLEKAEFKNKKQRIINHNAKEELQTILAKPQLEQLGIGDTVEIESIKEVSEIFSPPNEPNTNYDLFQNDNYEAFHENSFWEEYEDLIYALSKGKIKEAFKIIKEDQINLNETIRPNGDSLLHCAAEYGKIKMVQKLISEGADYIQKNEAGEQPIHVAAREGSLEVVKYFVDDMNLGTNTPTLDNWTPLFYACVNGYVSMAEYLLNAKANMNLTDRFGRTPLHWAAVTNNSKIIELLIKGGADHLISDAESRTAYDIAKENENKESVRYLRKVYREKGSAADQKRDLSPSLRNKKSRKFY